MTNEPNADQSLPAAPAVPEPVDWERYQPLAGLEHLGRAILDQDGQPSGSPANFEHLRGSPHPDGWPAVQREAVIDAEAILAQLRRDLPQAP